MKSFLLQVQFLYNPLFYPPLCKNPLLLQGSFLYNPFFYPPLYKRGAGGDFTKSPFLPLLKGGECEWKFYKGGYQERDFVKGENKRRDFTKGENRKKNFEKREMWKEHRAWWESAPSPPTTARVDPPCLTDSAGLPYNALYSSHWQPAAQVLACSNLYVFAPFDSFREVNRAWWESNPQPLAPEANALSC